jgi:tRNA nucleotidyltransferase (CCA-adding enzyme)
MDLIERLTQEADAAGFSLYLVGGAVRDFLLGLPVRDVDLSVAGPDGASAEALSERVAGNEFQVRKHGRFGTLRISTVEVGVDLATLRSESYPHPGALPKVGAGTFEEDLQRRDFTINALAIPLIGLDRNSEITVIDIQGGLEDLEAKQLRVNHSKSFHDDPTRALRAARLAPRLGFTLSRDSRSSLRDALRDGAFGAVSGDRLRREFERLFADASRGQNPAEPLKLLQDWHVLSVLEPGLSFERKAVTPLRRLGKLLAMPLWRTRDFRPWVAGLCIWLAPLPPALRGRVVKRLSIRGEASNRIVGFAKSRNRWTKLLERARGRGAIDGLLQGIDEEQFHALFASSDPRIRRRLERWAAEDRDRRPPVTGRDLENAGITGPAVGRALSRIRSAYLDGAVANREEALALARELQQRSSRTRKQSRPERRAKAT